MKPALKILFTQPLSQGIIHPSLKMAAIIPILKSSDKMTPANSLGQFHRLHPK